MNVTDWLRNLGLERYEAAFRENDVTAEVLAHLTAEDLKELGVVAVGHRRQLLVAIAGLRDDATSLQTVRRAGDHRASAAAGERRQITVLFCDIVGSTPLSTGLDPEELREILTAYQMNVAAAVTGENGYIARFVGDGVLAYFGWPNADEAHAESAVRAGLAIVAEVGLQQLSVRIGIATGLVVAGDLAGVGAAQTVTAVGETPNLAARLQALAQPDTIVVSDATRSQVRQMFDLDDLGPLALKGFESPIRAWRVSGKTTAVSRSEVVYARTLMPLVGRDEELRLLLRQWDESKAGEGGIVLVSGEAGIGKSRLLAALEERLSGEPCISLRYFCSPHHQGSPLYPFITKLEREVGLSRADNAADCLTKLETFLAPTEPPAEDVALIAMLLSIPLDGRYPALELSPKQRKVRTLAALLRRLSTLARRKPVLFLFEDVHWSDPSSIELLNAVTEHMSDLPVLLIVSFRPEFVAPWLGRARARLITLGRLAAGEATTLAAQVATKGVLTPTILGRIVTQADGVPLFIEELTKAVEESRTTGGTATPDTASQPPMTVPVTLQASLMARLDRLGSTKKVAQVGAVIGRTFDYELLAAASGWKQIELDSALRRLVDSGLVFVRGESPQSTYVFKHALVQDTAYDSLLRAPRKALHRKVAETLESRFGVVGTPGLVRPAPEHTQFAQSADVGFGEFASGDHRHDRHQRAGQTARPALTEALSPLREGLNPQLLAHHWSEAGEPRRAAAWWLIGARQTLDKLAPAEALAQTERGLAQLEQLPEDAWRWQTEVELQLVAANALMVTHGHAAARTATALARATELCERLPSTKQRLDAQYGLLSHLSLHGELPRALGLAEEMLAADNCGSEASRCRLAGLRARGYVHFLFGRFDQSIEDLQQFISLWDSDQPVEGLGLAHDPGSVNVHCYRSYSLTLSGRISDARHHVAAAMQGALASGHHLIVAQAMFTEAVLIYHTGAPEDARRLLELTLAYATEHGVAYFKMFASIYLSSVEGRAGDVEGALRRIGPNVEFARDSGTYAFLPGFLAREGELLTLAGRIPEAMALFAEALALGEQTSSRWDESRNRRLFARALVADDRAAEAEAELRRALDVARSQRARLFELEVACDLAPMLSAKGRLGEALDLLQSCIVSFDKEEDTLTTLVRARAIMRKIAFSGA